MSVGACSLLCLGLAACGRVDPGAAGSPPPRTRAGEAVPARVAAQTVAGPGGTLWVRASAPQSDGVGVPMGVRVDGVELASVNVHKLAPMDFAVPLPAPLKAGSRVDVVYLDGSPAQEDGVTMEDRALKVDSLRVDDGLSLAAEWATLDLGDGAEAFDGLDTLPGQPVLWTHGALRFVWPATPPALGGSTVTVQAHGSLLQGQGPQMSVWVNGLPLSPAGVEVRNVGTAQGYVFSAPEALPAGATVDVVFSNDAVLPAEIGYAEDRNLVVESVRVDEEPPLAPEQATLDLGQGTAAFDGLDTLPGQPGLWWDGALRFRLPGPDLAAP